MKITSPYLHFMGNTEEAMTFYKSVFGGKFLIHQKFRDLPGSERMPKQELDKIIHISLDMGNGNTLMATDALESMGQQLTIGNNFHICVHTESEKETDRLFNDLAAGGEVEMPLNKTLWGAYFGMVKDKFSIQWMISYTYDGQKVDQNLSQG
ncbi:MAG TPA: VOC family protein [Cyclobacteriaceae bacterium]|nr:VOC family protein [Cyclobacteriaceae bacterium]